MSQKGVSVIDECCSAIKIHRRSSPRVQCGNTGSHFRGEYTPGPASSVHFGPFWYPHDLSLKYGAQFFDPNIGNARAHNDRAKLLHFIPLTLSHNSALGIFRRINSHLRHFKKNNIGKRVISVRKVVVYISGLFPFVRCKGCYSLRATHIRLLPIIKQAVSLSIAHHRHLTRLRLPLVFLRSGCTTY